MFKGAPFALCAAVILVSGCDELTSSSKGLSTDAWEESKPGIYDGAVRIGAITFRKGRWLTVRCFAGSTKDARRDLDIRYTVSVSPPLDNIGKAFKGVDGLTLNVSVDDDPAVLVSVRAGFGSGPWFLGIIDKSLADKIRNARKRVVAVPHADREALDEAIEFGVKDVAKQIARVLDACHGENTVSTAKPAP
jgi:hypothetical protein